MIGTSNFGVDELPKLEEKGPTWPNEAFGVVVGVKMAEAVVTFAVVVKTGEAVVSVVVVVVVKYFKVV